MIFKVLMKGAGGATPLAWLFVALFGTFAYGQASTTSSTQPSITMMGPAEASNASVIRDALGRPCLDVEAAARRQVVNPQMLDHVVSINNKCPRLIKLKVCYLKSDRCRELDLQSYKRVDTILGTMAGVSFFRYMILQR
ncbi:hypothetical protein E4K66_24090 [Bradyrhizobium frederickii]|uniref:Uncharacterized protein n=1 Tax=Bradyrhizobium frederickii TaxID=2560054 RepID=A0A4Y9KYG2_9BRAD|nr:hypothetical protein [Bradyrhizobium frederickii]TFV36378.1 hypothetical protein E4K66_24090 [Bradyrhizobium frederickii]